MRTQEDVRMGRKSRENGRPEGIRMKRKYSAAGTDPFDAVRWELRNASITNEKGETVFEQRDVEVPELWSAMATNVVVSKYFRGAMGTPQRERSVKQVIGRVVDTITRWGGKDGYFATDEDLAVFSAELKHILLHQMASFNSPVWFNVGIEERPQCSACFILSLEDNIASIMDRAQAEVMLFKYGSGSGINFSSLRSSRELLAGGGTASGPVSFMKGFDAFAGVIKSGGKTRRAAKMVILDVDHPDILEFIDCKMTEEKKAWTLIEAGYDGSLNGEAYASIFFQNSNNSVRVSDEFMKAYMADGDWTVRARTDGSPLGTYRAREIMRRIAEAAWACGDPGMQYDTTINDWHTCKATGRIYASNPCSEYMFLNDSACNLASLNLMKFASSTGELDVESFRHAIDVLITAQEILVGSSRYPTAEIEASSHKFRPLGLGFANLGALLMTRGLPYDSNAGRAYAGAITALMTGEAYAQSARIAARVGAFDGFGSNRDSMLAVISKHRKAVDEIDRALAPTTVLAAARKSWDEARALGEVHGYRNAQATVLAPTGTIAFMMDCDTTGVEPDIALVKYKKLVGGGMMKIVNQTVPMALKNLGYAQGEIGAIVEHIDTTGTIEAAPGLRDEHLPVFDCAFKPAAGTRTIEPMGHVRMMAATQPFLSGAISKTVNMSNEATAQEIEKVYFDAWNLGLKAIAIYRDGCKRAQPLSTRKEVVETRSDVAVAPPVVQKPLRRRLNDERQSLTHKFSIAGHEGYLTVGQYPDGSPGEIFIRMAKEGSVVCGLMDAFATMTSLALQYGVPLQVLVAKFSHTRFEPSGFTTNPDIPIAKSIMDYIFRWLALKYLAPAEVPEEYGHSDSIPPPPSQFELRSASVQELEVSQLQSDAPPCHECGGIMVRSGACYRCMNCGTTSGCS
ncbi:MAG: vitamin B12-dependent ribonucleotide reductase [Deltaproteobacteria bacterium]|nr:vitamin B12-dependent ribonucleotide reductase [Deltaproteobacteria bacterium]